ncbi:MAG: glycosyltransferase family 2 protein, partial [Elusimicrobiota bacterium]
MNLPPWDVSAACLGLAASQLFAAVRFLRRARSQKEKPLPAAQPPVSVIIPCAGESPELEASVRALLEQEYPGEAEFLFVCPGKDDPSFLKLSSLLGWRKDGKCSLLASGLAPSRSSGKAADLLFAAGRARSSSELLLFVDSDLRVRPGWQVLRVAVPAIGRGTMKLDVALSIPEHGLSEQRSAYTDVEGPPQVLFVGERVAALPALA